MGELGPFGGACVCGELGAFECGVCGAWVGVELGAERDGISEVGGELYADREDSGEWGAGCDGKRWAICGCVGGGIWGEKAPRRCGCVGVEREHKSRERARGCRL